MGMDATPEQRLATLGWVLPLDGFSDVMVAVFGEARGRGARAAVGMVTLSRQHAVEVEMILEVDGEAP